VRPLTGSVKAQWYARPFTLGRDMHTIRVLISHENSEEGEQWVTHTFGDHELDYMLAKIRHWESMNIPFEHTYERATPSPM
jgi:hypothetical protein